LISLPPSIPFLSELGSLLPWVHMYIKVQISTGEFRFYSQIWLPILVTILYN